MDFYEMTRDSWVLLYNGCPICVGDFEKCLERSKGLFDVVLLNNSLHANSTAFSERVIEMAKQISDKFFLYDEPIKFSEFIESMDWSSLEHVERLYLKWLSHMFVTSKAIELLNAFEQLGIKVP